MNTKDIATNGISVLTGGYALMNINDILSTTILILSILNILFNMGYAIYKHIKNKQLDAISNDIEEANKQLEQLKRKEDKK